MRLLLALLLLWLVSMPAHAATYPDRPSAAAGCEAAGNTFRAQLNAQGGNTTYPAHRCDAFPASKEYRLFINRKPVGDWIPASSIGGGAQYYTHTWLQECSAPHLAWDEASKSCQDTRCKNLPVVPTNPVNEGRTWCQTNTDSSGASYSCEVLGLRQLPTQPFAGYVAGNGTGDSCDPNTYECPNGYRKQADGTCQPVPECPDGVPVDGGTGQCTQPAECPTGKKKDANGECVPEKEICPVGQVKGPDGSCVKSDDQCPTGQAEGKDGSCKPDTDGDGEPDEESDDHKAEDSPTCDRPPLCSGDEIMCLHAKQLWRIDCNTRKARNVIMGEYCQKMPVCESVALGDDARNVGCDAVEEAALIQQWRTACATSEMLKLMKEGGGGTDGGDAGTHSRLDAIKAFLDGNGQQVATPEVPFIEQPIQSQEWDSGLGGSGTCPAPISTSVTIGGHTAPINFSFEPLCQFANYLYAVVVTMGGLMAAFIIAGVRK